MQWERLPGKHTLLTCGSLVGLTIALLATGLREKLAAGIGEVDRADPFMLGCAGLAFASGLLCCGLAWRAGLQAAGVRTSPADATSRYVAGSLVNSLVPLRAGGAVRVALYVRVARSVRVVAGVAAAVGAPRAASLAVLVCVASATAPVPTWPCAALLGAAMAAAGVAAWLGRSLTGLRAVTGWVCAAALARVAGATFVALAFDAPSPLLAGCAVVAAMELASTLPLTPGNVALSSAAVAFVLAAYGLPGDIALAAGLSLAGVETATSIALGLCGVAYLTGTVATVGRGLRTCRLAIQGSAMRGVRPLLGAVGRAG
jgi:uncharacterized membrane protein YbhN (UPF0104 family)